MDNSNEDEEEDIYGRMIDYTLKASVSLVYATRLCNVYILRNGLKYYLVKGTIFLNF